MPLNPASQFNDRGFLVYGGSPVDTSYGHVIRVQESSAASGPHVWLFIEGGPEPRPPGVGLRPDRTEPSVAPHLSLAQAIEIRDRLTQFIDEVPERWTRGKSLLKKAHEEVDRRRAEEREEKVT